MIFYSIIYLSSSFDFKQTPAANINFNNEQKRYLSNICGLSNHIFGSFIIIIIIKIEMSDLENYIKIIGKGGSCIRN